MIKYVKHAEEDHTNGCTERCYFVTDHTALPREGREWRRCCCGKWTKYEYDPRNHQLCQATKPEPPTITCHPGSKCADWPYCLYRVGQYCGGPPRL